MHVACGGGQYLAVASTSGNTVKAARVAASGTNPVSPAFVIDSGGYAARAAHDGKNFVVVWHRLNGYDVKFARITPAGTTATVLGLSDTLNLQKYPDVTFGGGPFFAVWEDTRNGATNLTDVYGMRFK